MHADIQGALNQINRSYKAFTHRGKRMSKDEVKKVLQFGLKRGYTTTDQFSDEEVDLILNVPNGEVSSVGKHEQQRNFCEQEGSDCWWRDKFTDECSSPNSCKHKLK